MMRDRKEKTGLTGQVLRLICNRRLVRISLLIAVALGVAAGVGNHLLPGLQSSHHSHRLVDVRLYFAIDPQHCGYSSSC